MLENKGYIEYPAQKLAVYSYFLSVLILTQIDNNFTTMFYYLSAFACLISLLAIKREIDLRIIMIMSIALLCGVCNMMLIGNLNIILLVLLSLSFFVAPLFLSDSVDSSVFLHIVILYVVFMLFMIMHKGVGNPIFTYVSNNYISVYLLSPIVLYYLKREEEYKDLLVMPAVLVWCVCLLGNSRSGLISATLLVSGLFFCKYFIGYNIRRKVFLICGIAFIVLPLAILLIPLLAKQPAYGAIIDRIFKAGLTSHARIYMWKEYLVLLKNPLFLFFGAPFDQVYLANKLYEGNVHNSFLFVHAYLGLVCFLGMLVMMVNCICFARKQKNYVFIVVFVAFCFRSLTDHVFGCNRITPIFLCFLMYPFYSFMYKKKRCILEHTLDISESKQDE